ncbi:hypothetical protein GCM10020256_58810 [Streptomyces thermocoprophilus]
MAGEAEEGLGVGFAAGSAAVVVAAGGGIVQGCERGEEHGSFQLPVAASGGVFAVDRRAGLLRCRGESGVGGQVTGGGERAAVADGGQEDCGGPDADAGHRGQDLRKRVGLQQCLDPGFQGPALFVDGGQRLRQRRDDHVEGVGARNDDRLLVECGEDVVDQSFGHARGSGPDNLDQLAAACLAQGLRGSVTLEQPGHRLVVQARAQDALEAGVELGEQAADAVGGAVGLAGEVLVEADQHGQLGGDLVGQVEGAQGVGHGAGGVRDDGRVLGVGLGLAGVEIGDPPHRQSGQVGDLAARVPGHRQGQGADGRGLVHDHQNRAELGRELVENGPQLRFAVRQRLVEDRLPGRGQTVAVMRLLADVQAQEDAHPVDADHRAPTCVDACRPQGREPFSRIHVMQTCRPQAAGHCARPDGGRTSDQRL